MDQFRSLLGDLVPTVAQHNLVTRPKSLDWCENIFRSLVWFELTTIDKPRNEVTAQGS